MFSKTVGKLCRRTTTSILRCTNGIVIALSIAATSFHRWNLSFDRSYSRSQYWFWASMHKLSHSIELHRSIASCHEVKTMTLPGCVIPYMVPTWENQFAVSNCSSVAFVFGCISLTHGLRWGSRMGIRGTSSSSRNPNAIL
jgi:hypothetical protein